VNGYFPRAWIAIWQPSLVGVLSGQPGRILSVDYVGLPSADAVRSSSVAAVGSSATEPVGESSADSIGTPTAGTVGALSADPPRSLPASSVGPSLAVEIEMNSEFVRALALLDSGQSAFITGKAGTGKSTLLSLWRDQQFEMGREPVVTAPTGVAALNVNGSTIHRLFGFGPSITPEDVESGDWYPHATVSTLRELRTLVIDEISMCRADLLDTVDAALRRYGPRPDSPFGGVQLVMFGDPYQLSPVVQEEEEHFFTHHYSTPFFFGSKALSELDFDVVELQRVYRQSDEMFVGLLNRVREGTVTSADLEVLQSRVDSDFDPPSTGGDLYVTLTTTNRDAERVNRQHLEGLQAASGFFQARTGGDVRPGDRPTDELLELKPGAQVMLLNNDSLGRWVNGSLAAVTRVQDHSVVVRLLDTGIWVEVEPYTWEIVRPVADGRRIRNELVGRFEQLPIRLGWAVTIHKSQGKTLPRTIISLGRGSFADGQTYVALSRCTSLDGIVLRRQVRRRDIRVSADVRRFLRERAVATGEITPPMRGWAVVGAITTGYGEHDRVLEIACDLWGVDGSRQRFHTLVNPTRDVGDPTVHGIRASDVTHAPTFAEVWPFLARCLHGYVLVADGLLPLLRVFDSERNYAPELLVDWGVGVCTREQVGGTFPTGTRTAVDRVVATGNLFHQIDTGHLAISPVQTESLHAVGRLLPRGGSVVPSLAANPGFDDALNYADMMAAAMTDPEVNRADLASLAEQFSLGDVDVRRVHEEFGRLTATAVRRDRNVSQVELDHVKSTFAVLDLPIPADLSAASESVVVDPQPGWKTCFTGTALDSRGEVLERDEVLEWAESLGLRTMKSVTKNTDLLVVADRASMSGKARKAQAYGTTIMSIPEWLRWAQQSR
jgi:ATP-dependent DNA helicase PIF1